MPKPNNSSPSASASPLGRTRTPAGRFLRAVVTAGDELRARTQREEQAQCLLVVGDRGDGYRVVAVVFECAQVGAGPGQVTHRLALARERGHVQRRAAVGVARIDLGAGGHQGIDARRVPAPGRSVQAGVGGRLRRAGRALRRRRRRADQNGQHGCGPQPARPRTTPMAHGRILQPPPDAMPY